MVFGTNWPLPSWGLDSPPYVLHSGNHNARKKATKGKRHTGAGDQRFYQVSSWLLFVLFSSSYFFFFFFFSFFWNLEMMRWGWWGSTQADWSFNVKLQWLMERRALSKAREEMLQKWEWISSKCQSDWMSMMNRLNRGYVWSLVRLGIRIRFS